VTTHRGRVLQPPDRCLHRRARRPRFPQGAAVDDDLRRAKLTGKTASGWSVGVLDAVTGRESAEVVFEDVRSTPVVAPLTQLKNAIARIKRDLGDGKTSIGVSATAVHRKLEDTASRPRCTIRPTPAASSSSTAWADDAWIANANLLGSLGPRHPGSDRGTQQSARHYFQRPDASDVHLDLARTSLSGLAARWTIGQMGDTKHWRYGFSGDLRTPGLELNDAGFQQTSDRIAPYLTLQYRENTQARTCSPGDPSPMCSGPRTSSPGCSRPALEYNVNGQLANYWEIIHGRRHQSLAMVDRRAARWPDAAG